MVFHMPQILVMAWLFIALASKAGKATTAGFWLECAETFIFFWLLYFGGFFNGTSP